MIQKIQNNLKIKIKNYLKNYNKLIVKLNFLQMK